MPRYILLIIKIALSVGLVWYAFSKIDISDAWLYLRNMSGYVIFVVVALLFIQLVVAALRLRELLVLLGARCSVIKALDVVMIGSFFSQTLISFVGGDAMRIWRIVRSNISLGLATRGILFDRTAGFAGLIALIVFGLPFLMQLIEQPHMRWSLLLAVAIGGAGFLAFLSLARMPQMFRQWRAFRWAADLSSIALSISKSKKGLIALLGFSLVIHILNVIILYIIASGLSIQISFWNSMILLPPVLFISMLPISVAGWGVREGAMVVTLGLVGIPAHQSLALSICFGLCLAGISLPGGVLWFLSRGHTGPDGVNLAPKKE